MSTEFAGSFSESEFNDIIHLYEINVQDDFDFDFEDMVEVDLSILPLKFDPVHQSQNLKSDESNLLSEKEVNSNGPFNDIACFKGHDLDSIDAKSLEKLFNENPKVDLEEYYDDEWIDLTDSGLLGISCNHCRSEFSSRQEFLSHAVDCFKRDIVEYTCRTCNQSFTRFSAFRKHTLRHNPEKYKCLYCDAEFDVQSGLVGHISAAHSSIYPYVCSECGLLCPNESVFSLHQKKFHPYNKGYACKICNRVLFLKKNLIRHVRVHNAGKVYMCDACGKLFLYKPDLMRHLASIHAKKRPYPCDECGKRFPDENLLKRHRKMHTTERPFVCTICTKSFKTRAALNTHSLTHDFTKRFSCSKCNKGFNKSSKLKEHEYIHTGERPYQCQYCPRSFTNSPNLLKHTRRIHSNEPHSKTTANNKHIVVNTSSQQISNFN